MPSPAPPGASSLLPHLHRPHRSRGAEGGVPEGDASGPFLLPVPRLGDSPLRRSTPTPSCPVLPLGGSRCPPPRALQFISPYLAEGWQSPQRSETFEQARGAEHGGEGRVRHQQGWEAFSCSVLGVCCPPEPLSALSPLLWLHPGGFLGSLPSSQAAPPLPSAPTNPTPCFKKRRNRVKPNPAASQEQNPVGHVPPSAVAGERRDSLGCSSSQLGGLAVLGQRRWLRGKKGRRWLCPPASCVTQPTPRGFTSRSGPDTPRQAGFPYQQRGARSLLSG